MDTFKSIKITCIALKYICPAAFRSAGDYCQQYLKRINKEKILK